MSTTHIAFGPSSWTSPVTSKVPRSPKSSAGFQFLASVCLNVSTAPFSPARFDKDGSNDWIFERSGGGGSGDPLVFTSVDFGSDILSIRAGGWAACFVLLS